MRNSAAAAARKKKPDGGPCLPERLVRVDLETLRLPSPLIDGVFNFLRCLCRLRPDVPVTKHVPEEGIIQQIYSSNQQDY